MLALPSHLLSFFSSILFVFSHFLLIFLLFLLYTFQLGYWRNEGEGSYTRQETLCDGDVRVRHEQSMWIGWKYFLYVSTRYEIVRSYQIEDSIVIKGYYWMSCSACIDEYDAEQYSAITSEITICNLQGFLFHDYYLTW